MGKRVVIGLAAMAVLLVMAAHAFQAVPRLTSVDPDSGKKGDVISAKGESLSKASIAELYLSDPKNDTKAEITEQSDTEIKFKVPAVAPGRYHLTTLGPKRDALVEQPVVFTVE